MAPGYIVISAYFHRETAQRHVAVRSAVQHAILSETHVIALKPFMNSPRLIKFWPAVLYGENFLNSDPVSSELSDHGSAPLRSGPAGKHSTVVAIVSGA